VLSAVTLPYLTNMEYVKNAVITIKINTTMGKKYFDIPNYDSLYKIDEFGNIISYMSKTPIKLKPSINRKGYLRVWLYKDQKRKEFKIHTLVAMTFKNFIPNGMKDLIHHLDENKLNNHKDNLEITTNRKNVSHSIKNTERSSKFIGVSWNKFAKKWSAKIRVNGKYKHIGYFKSEFEASFAYRKELSLITN